MDRHVSGPPTRIDHALRALTLVIGLAVVALSLGPPPDSEGLMSDKLAHFLSYFSFTYCALLGFMGRPGRPPVDALANAAGASLGLVVWILTVRRTPQQA